MTGSEVSLMPIKRLAEDDNVVVTQTLGFYLAVKKMKLSRFEVNTWTWETILSKVTLCSETRVLYALTYM